MSTLAEIEKAIETLPPDQWQEIRRWMDCHAPKKGAVELADFDVWLAASTGMVKGRV